MSFSGVVVPVSSGSEKSKKKACKRKAPSEDRGGEVTVDDGSSTSTSSSIMVSASTSKRGRPVGHLTHPVHELFAYDDVRKESTCLITPCNKKVTGIKHAGNLMKHLKAYHKDIHDTVTKKAEKLRSSRPDVKKAVGVLNGVEMSGPALQLHSIRLVTEHGLSFKVMDYSAFQDIIQPLIRQMPAKDQPTITSRSIPDKIPQFAKFVREEIAKEVNEKMVSLQVDGCSKGYRHFVGINIQYIMDKEVYSRTLGVEELHDRSSAANLKAVITMTLKKYGLSVRQLVSFTSDTGANYVLAGKLLQEDEEQDEELDAIDNFEDPVDWPESIELLQGDFCIQSIKCAEHTLQSAIGDVVKKDHGLQQLLVAIRKLANFLKNETVAMQLKNAGLPLPVLGCTTRWGYDYDMAKSVVRLRSFIDMSLKCTPKERKENFLNDDQWERVAVFLDVFRPLRRATTKLQGKQITLGDFFAIWSEAKMTLEKKATEGSDLATRLLVAMEERSKSVLYKRPGSPERLPSLFFYPSFSAALFLDPRFFAVLKPEQTADAKAYLIELWMRYLSLKPLPANKSDNELADEEDSDDDSDLPPSSPTSRASPRPRHISFSSSEDEGSSIFASFMQRENEKRKSQSERASGTGAKAQARAKLRALLDEYDRVVEPIEMDANVLTYWETKRLIWPELYELALIVLAIPATQVSVERLFSSLKFILRPQRFNLKSGIVDDLLVLHVNPDLVRKVALNLEKISM